MVFVRDWKWSNLEFCVQDVKAMMVEGSGREEGKEMKTGGRGRERK